MVDKFYSVDWGTSNFRLRLIEVSTLTLLNEVSSEIGVKVMHQRWIQKGGNKENIFLNYLSEQIDKIQSGESDLYPIVISGMASSSIGIKELEYTKLSFYLSGKDLHVEWLETSVFANECLLISGVCTQDDVMRGEEVQLIGLNQILENTERGFDVFIFPGTHSKHVLCNAIQALDFNTYMTGELFDAIMNNTILAQSVEEGSIDKSLEVAFRNGVCQANQDISVLLNLFKIRAQDLLEKREAKENYFYLSGLLIGEELKRLDSSQFEHIYLCADKGLAELYKYALEELKLISKSTIVASELVNQAVVAGQLRILEEKIKNKG